MRLLRPVAGKACALPAQSISSVRWWRRLALSGCRIFMMAKQLVGQAEAAQQLRLLIDILVEARCKSRGIGEIARALMQPPGHVGVGLLPDRKLAATCKLRHRRGGHARGR